jgi:hypothetical protein
LATTQAEFAVGDLDVAVFSDVGGGGQFDGRQGRRVHSAAAWGFRRRPVDEYVPAAVLEQRS